MKNKNESERRCKKCGKLLVNEKLPICKRCSLELRNIGGAGSILAVALGVAKKVADDNN